MQIQTQKKNQKKNTICFLYRRLVARRSCQATQHLWDHVTEKVQEIQIFNTLPRETERKEHPRNYVDTFLQTTSRVERNNSRRKRQQGILKHFTRYYFNGWRPQRLLFIWMWKFCERSSNVVCEIIIFGIEVKILRTKFQISRLKSKFCDER